MTSPFVLEQQVGKKSQKDAGPCKVRGKRTKPGIRQRPWKRRHRKVGTGTGQPTNTAAKYLSMNSKDTNWGEC